MESNPWTRAALLACLFLGTSACEKGDGKPTATEPRATDEQIGERIELAGGTVTVGFAHGRLRRDVAFEAFSISKYPISVREFEECLSSGVCSAELDPSCGEVEGNEPNHPALCVGSENAAAYCRWAGGSVPTLPQWLVAARGPSIKRFSWGDDLPDHDRHGRISEPIELDPALTYGYQPAFQEQPISEIGEHSSGASPSGVEDILLSPGELLISSPDGQFNPCLGDGRECVVYGHVPGAIDAVRPAIKSKEAEEDVGVIAVPGRPEDSYGFRCVWVEGE